ncbi:MAG: hypothetical protein Q4C34_07375 [Bacteroidales bacterium]|nr:hypothetical protein [Bacteroidales bacterium]
MKKIATILTGSAIALAGIMTVASCGHDTKFIGSWTATTPTSIAPELPAASTATSLMSIDFLAGPDTNKGGGIYMSSLIEATQPVKTDTAGMPVDAAYEVSVSATASVGGTWTYKDGDDDELILAFDMSTLKIEVDPRGVVFSENMLTGAQQPAVDSLTARTAEVWKRQIRSAMTSTLNRFGELDDVKVSHDGTTMTFEVKDVTGHDEMMIMRRVINSD